MTIHVVMLWSLAVLAGVVTSKLVVRLLEAIDNAVKRHELQKQYRVIAAEQEAERQRSLNNASMAAYLNEHGVPDGWLQPPKKKD